MDAAPHRSSRTAALVAVAANDLRMWWRDPSMLVAYTLMAVALIAAVTPAFNWWLASESATAEASVLSAPGAATVFNIVLLSNFASVAYRDYSTGVWNRIRSTHLRPRDVLIARFATVWLVHFAQFMLVLSIAAAFFDLPLLHNVPAVVGLAACAVTAIVALGFAMFAIFNSSSSYEAAVISGGVILGGLGGAFAPLQLLKKWSENIQPVSPVYWVVTGFGDAFGGSPDKGNVVRSSLVLLAFSALFVITGCWKFDAGAEKATTR